MSLFKSKPPLSLAFRGHSKHVRFIGMIHGASSILIASVFATVFGQENKPYPAATETQNASSSKETTVAPSLTAGATAVSDAKATPAETPAPSTGSPAPITTATALPNQSPLGNPTHNPNSTAAPVPTQNPTQVPTQKPTPTAVPTISVNVLPNVDSTKPIEVTTSSVSKPESALPEELLSPLPSDQFVFSRSTPSASDKLLFFKKRSGFTGEFQVYGQSVDDDLVTPFAFPQPWVGDSFYECSGTGEIIIQTKPVGADGRLIPGGSGRKVFLYDPKSRTLSLIWKRGMELVGSISHKIFADPNCEHIFIPLNLKEQGSKAAYASLVLAERPRKIIDEWPSRVLFSTQPGAGVDELDVLGAWGKNPQSKQILVVLRSKSEKVPDSLLEIRLESARKNPPILVHAALTKKIVKPPIPLLKISAFAQDPLSPHVIYAGNSEDYLDPKASFKTSIVAYQFPAQEFSLVATVAQSVVPSLAVYNLNIAVSYVGFGQKDSEDTENRKNSGNFVLLLKNKVYSSFVLHKYTSSFALSPHNVSQVRWIGSQLLVTIPEISDSLEGTFFERGASNQDAREFPSKIFKWRLFK